MLLPTNPVDPLLTWIHRVGWFDPAPLVGYTVNDSPRLRTAAAQVVGRHPGDVARTLGEHGEHQVPSWDRVFLGGEVVPLGPEQVARAQEYVGTWYTKHVALDSGRTSTWTTGLGAAATILAMVDESADPFPVSAPTTSNIPAAAPLGGLRAFAEAFRGVATRRRAASAQQGVRACAASPRWLRAGTGRRRRARRR